MLLKSFRLVLALALASIVLVPGVASAGTLDQQQTNSTTAALATGRTWLAQTFTAQIGGQLDQVDLYLGLENRPSGPATVQIRTVSGGAPSSVVLASASVPIANVPDAGGWVSVPVSAPSVAGTQYAIVLGQALVSPDGYQWGEDRARPYAPGAAYGSNDRGGSWVAMSSGGSDFTFKTYVTPPPDTTAPTVTCSAKPASLKSNNHKLASITTAVTVTDEAGGSGAAGFTLVSVQSSQADSGLRKDDRANDIQDWTIGTADTSGLLRAERYGSDRVYTLTYQGSDVAGNTATCQTTVTVTKHRILDGLLTDQGDLRAA